MNSPPGGPAAGAADADAAVAANPRIVASAEEMAELEEWPSDKDAYDFQVKIGAGNFAVVHMAVVKSKPKTHVCAIKKLDLEMLDINMDAIRKEITTMSRCVHPNVLALHKSFTDEEYLYIVLPYMNCGSFRDVILQREEHLVKEPNDVLLREEWIAMAIAETCAGLEYIHRKGWMHRDLKAANILLNQRGEVKLADFGVAGMKDSSDPVRRKEADQRRTFVGTPCWMAPEVMRQDKGYSDRADIWSLGICVLELAKGYPPFAKERAMKVLLRTIRDAPPNFDTYQEFEPQAPRRKFSSNIKNFVKALLMKDPKKRPTASACLSLAFLKPYTKDSVANRLRLSTELCSGLKTVDAQQLEEQTQPVLVRSASGQLVPLDAPKDEHGNYVVDGGIDSLLHSDGGSKPSNGDSDEQGEPSDDISVTELSRRLAEMNVGGKAPANLSALNTNCVSQSGGSDVFTPTVARSTREENPFTAKLTNRRVPKSAHDGNQSLEELPSKEHRLVDDEVPALRQHSFMPSDDRDSERRDIMLAVAELAAAELQQLRKLMQEESRRQVPEIPEPAAGAIDDGAAASVPDAEPAALAEPTAEQEAQLVQHLAEKKREAEAKKQAEEANHADLQNDAEFADAFSGL